MKKQDKILIEEKEAGFLAEALPRLVGELKVDVYETEKEIVVRSTVAGVDPKDLTVDLHNDLLTIRGRRHVNEEVKEDNFLVRECFWGDFSRSVILPTSVDVKKGEAVLKNGVLTIRLPKIKQTTSIPVRGL